MGLEKPTGRQKICRHYNFQRGRETFALNLIRTNKMEGTGQGCMLRKSARAGYGVSTPSIPNLEIQ